MRAAVALTIDAFGSLDILVNNAGLALGGPIDEIKFTDYERMIAVNVFVAVPWAKIPAALGGLPAWNGRIVVDANNSIEAPHFRPADLQGRTSSEVFAEMVPGARLVKAFNHLQPHLIEGDPRIEGGRRVLFYSGDDAGAKAAVAMLIEKLGFFGVDLGSLAIGARLVQFPGGPLPAHNLVKFG